MRNVSQRIVKDLNLDDLTVQNLTITGDVSFPDESGLPYNENLANVDYLVDNLVDFRATTSPGTASQSGTTVTGVGSNFSTAAANLSNTLVGGRIVFADGTTENIVSVASATSLTVATAATVPSQAYTLYFAPSAPFAWNITKSNDQEHIKTAGVLSYTDTTKNPASEYSIIRLASQSKFIGAFGLLQLVEKGLVSLFEPLSNYIPGFDPLVMQNFPVNSVKLLGNNPISVTNGSNIVIVTEPAHGRTNGDTIDIRNSTRIGNIPASLTNLATSPTVFATVTGNVATLTILLAPQLPAPNIVFGVGQSVNVSGFRGADVFFNGIFVLTAVTASTVSYNLVHADAVATTIGSVMTIGNLNDTHIVTVLTANTWGFAVPTISNVTTTGGGASVAIATLAPNVKRTSWQGIPYYYTTVNTVRPVLLYHIITYTLGYTYTLVSTGTSFGYFNNPTLRNIQAGLYSDNLIPMANASSITPLSWGTLEEWAMAMQNIPMVSQPGVDWIYGPGMSFLGPVIKQVDPLKRSIDVYLREQIFAPLGMNTTGFFIPPSQVPANLPNIQTLYFDGTKTPVSLFPLTAAFDNFFYSTIAPQTLCLCDGGLYSTPREFSLFINMILNGGYTVTGQRLISKGMLSYLSENHTLENTTYNILDLYPTTATPAKWPKWGCGIGVYTGVLASVSMAGTSKRAIGWSGAYGLRYLIDFTNNKTINVGFNSLGITSSNGWRERIVTANYSTFDVLYHNYENVEGENPFVSENPQ